MDFLSPQILFPMLTAIIMISIRTYYKSFWNKILRPALIIVSILSIFLVCILLFAAYTMIQNPFFSATEKILYWVVVAGLIVFFVWINLSCWKKWKDEHPHQK